MYGTIPRKIMGISHQTYDQLPLDGLFAPAPDTPVTRTGGQSEIRIDLPNWSTMWEIKKVDPKTQKVTKRRRVWDALHSNSRPGHWAQRHKATAEVISVVTLLATKQGLHRITGINHMTLELVWSVGSHRRVDSWNLAPIVKACVDALARGRGDLPGLNIVDDDTDKYVDQRVRIERPPTPAGLWLQLTLV